MDGTEHGISQVTSGENSPSSSSFLACNLLKYCPNTCISGMSVPYFQIIFSHLTQQIRTEYIAKANNQSLLVWSIGYKKLSKNNQTIISNIIFASRVGFTVNFD